MKRRGSGQKKYDLLEIVKIFAKSINNDANEILDNLSIGKNFEEVGIIQDYIIDHTCECLKVPREAIIGRKARGMATTARKVAVILMKKHLTVSSTKIGKLFSNRSRVIIHNILVEYKSLNRSNKIDCENFFQYYDPIQRDVISFINTLIDKKHGNGEGNKTGSDGAETKGEEK